MTTNTKASQSSSSHQSARELVHLSGLPVGQELIPECEVILEGEEDSLPDRLRDCEKNPGHPKFIPVKKFGFEHLPEELRAEQIMRDIKRLCNLTVRVVVRYTSTNRPDTFYDSKAPYPFSRFKGSKRKKRYGTGFILDCQKRQKKYGRCPCPLCQNTTDPKMEYWFIRVQTATHVIYDDSEAKCSEFDCFYDSEDGAGVKKLYGVSTHNKIFVSGSDFKSDLSWIRCVTHDKETVMRLVKEFACTIDAVFDGSVFENFIPKEVIVSHPHGCSKRITVGNVLYRTTVFGDCDVTEKPIPLIKNTICHIPTGILQDKEARLFDTSFFKSLLRRLTRSEIDNEPGFNQLLLPYIRTESVKSKHKALDIIIGIACGLYRYAITFNLISSFIVHVHKINHTITYLISHRLFNMKTSITKTPELVDIGFILWMCFLSVLRALLTDLRDKEKNIFESCGSITMMFLYNIYRWRPELLPLFDLPQFIAEKSQEYLIRDHVYSDIRQAGRAVVRILSGCDMCIGEEDNNSCGKFRCNDVTTDYDDYGDDDDDDDRKGRCVTDAIYFEKLITSFCQNVKTQFRTVQRHRKFHARIKHLTVPESDDFLQPGTEFLLPPNMFFTIPPHAEFFKRYYRDNPEYFSFPPGTKFYFVKNDYMIEFPLPDEAEFFHLGVYNREKMSITYNTDTCPGSSGAFLRWDLDVMTYALEQVHCGAVGNKNNSGITSFHGNIRDVDGLINHMNNDEKQDQSLRLFEIT